MDGVGACITKDTLVVGVANCMGCAYEVLASFVAISAILCGAGSVEDEEVADAVVVVAVGLVVEGVVVTPVVFVVVAVEVVVTLVVMAKGDPAVGSCNFSFFVCGLPGGFGELFNLLMATSGKRRLGGLPLYMLVSSSHISSSSGSLASG